VSEISKRFKNVMSRIGQAADQAGRSKEDISLMAVSKKQSVESIMELFELGQRAFGESYLQEATQKQHQLQLCEGLTWHFIGPIQSNKTRLIAEQFDWVHSVDRLKIAQRLSEQRQSNLGDLQICLQVNISAEPTKSGVSPDEIKQLALQVSKLPHLRLRGLMAIPKRETDFEKQRVPYRMLRKLKEELSQDLSLDLDMLSMGVSDDYEAAIAEGATIVRVGTELFGPRG